MLRASVPSSPCNPDCAAEDCQLGGAHKACHLHGVWCVDGQVAW